MLAYHYGIGGGGGAPATLLDLGCGPGTVARALAPRFSRVVAVDPSEGMVAQAAREARTPGDGGGGGGPAIEFRRGCAEALSAPELGLAPGSVDVAVAAQSAHWFDWPRAWPELARVVRRPGGTLALLGYKDVVLAGRPRPTAVMNRVVYGDTDAGEAALEDDTTLARFWERPGVVVARGLLRAVEPPAADWADVRRLEFRPDRSTCVVPSPPPPPPNAGEEGLVEDGECWLRRTMRLGDLEDYLRTFSAYRAWRDANPGRRSRAEGGGPGDDILDAMFEEMVAAEHDWAAMGDAWREAEVEVAWGTGILLARRR